MIKRLWCLIFDHDIPFSITWKGIWFTPCGRCGQCRQQPEVPQKGWLER